MLRNIYVYLVKIINLNTIEYSSSGSKDREISRITHFTLPCAEGHRFERIDESASFFFFQFYQIDTFNAIVEKVASFFINSLL